MNRALSAVFLCTILFFFTIGSAQNAAAPSAATDKSASQLGSQQHRGPPSSRLSRRDDLVAAGARQDVDL